MRNLLVFLIGVVLLCSAFALFSTATWGEPIRVDAMEPIYTEEKAAAEEPGVHEEVRAKRFVIVNEKGMPVGVLGVFSGQLSLLMHDQDKKLRAVLGVDRGGQPGIGLLGQNGKLRAQFDIDGDEPRLVLFDKNGKVRAKLDVKESEPRLMLFDENGNATYQVPQ